jgi:hypothetical protein
LAPPYPPPGPSALPSRQRSQRHLRPRYQPVRRTGLPGAVRRGSTSCFRPRWLVASGHRVIRRACSLRQPRVLSGLRSHRPCPRQRDAATTSGEAATGSWSTVRTSRAVNGPASGAFHEAVGLPREAPGEAAGGSLQASYSSAREVPSRDVQPTQESAAVTRASTSPRGVANRQGSLSMATPNCAAR